MKKLVALICILILSAALNVYLLTRENLPLITSSGNIDSVTMWSNSDLMIEGVPVSLEDRKSNIRGGYELFTISIREDSVSGGVECKFQDTLVHDQIVNIDGPLNLRSCQVLKLDIAEKLAIAEAKGVTFTVNGQRVSWQDREGSGPLISVLERSLNRNKYL